MNKFQINLNNYKSALARLHDALDESKENTSFTLRDGVIFGFKFTINSAWKVLREYLLTAGIIDINSPKKVMREAYNNDLIENTEGWLRILDDRNLTSHVYDDEDAADIYNRIMNEHIKLFDELEKVLDRL